MVLHDAAVMLPLEAAVVPATITLFVLYVRESTRNGRAAAQEAGK